MKEAIKSIVKGWKDEQKVLCKIFNGRGEEMVNKETEKYRKYLENSVYIVPPMTLLAYQYVDGINIPVQDQTVWVIDKYDKGYFFGKTYAALNGEPGDSFNMSGSITPSGEIYITFLGNGKFIITKQGGYFLMQTDSAENSSFGLAHWSYMVSVVPTDYWYQNLPSVNMSVPDFISLF